MIPHNHIDQKARLPEVCPGCALMWKQTEDAMYGAGQTIVINCEEEFAVARNLRVDWDDNTAWHHLTETRDRALMEKAHNTGVFRGRG